MRTCPKCGRKYSAPPAMSRIDNSDICPVCGAVEALQADEIIAQIEKNEIAFGRVEPK